MILHIAFRNIITTKYYYCGVQQFFFFSCWTLASYIRLLIILLSLLDSSLEAMLIIAELPLIFLVKSNVHLFFGKAIRHSITADAMVLPRVIVN